MNMLSKFSVAIGAAIIGSTMLSQPVLADSYNLVLQAKGGNKPDKSGNDGGGGGGSVRTPAYYSWMSDEIQGAWDGGYLGQGVTITVVDDFNSRSKIFGNLGEGLSRSRHGEWTLKQAGMIAPSATMVSDDFTSGDTVPLADGFNVLNLSYGWLETTAKFTVLDAQEQSIVDYADGGFAFISKSAGNYSIAVGTIITSGTYAGNSDYLSSNLIGTQSAIFVGALDSNGTTANKASLASYSNFAGADLEVQAQFLVVGVADNLTGLAGTSFAAPIISGYAAVLSSKFTAASPTQVANQLLSTARIDTIAGYDVAVHGQGEASIALAISPDYIN